MENLLRLRDGGKIRYIGVSNISDQQTLEALDHGPIRSSQPCYNMLHRDPEEDESHACLKNGIGVICYSPLSKGLLTGKYRLEHRVQPGDERARTDVTVFEGETFQRMLEVSERLKVWALDHGRARVQAIAKWTLAHPAVTSSIVGSKSPKQVRHNARAADWCLTESDLAEIDEIQGDLRLHGW